MSLRREVFLQGADGVALAMEVISKMADMSLSDSDIVNLSLEVPKLLARTQVIGGEATFAAVAQFSVTFTGAFHDLYVARSALRADDTDKIENYIPFLKMCSERNSELLKHIPPALFAVRHELEIPTDRDRFLEIQNIASQRQMARLDALLKEQGQ